MFSFFSIVCISVIIIKSNGNPIVNNSNVTDVNNSDSQPRLVCDRNVVLTSNSSLYELLNNNRLWLILARTKFVYGEQTWNNTLMQTSTTINDTIYLEFIGENSNGTCVNSGKGQIVSDTKSNRVLVQWSKKEGFLEMVFIDESMIHFILCYSIDSNKTDVCAHNQREQFVIQNNQQQDENDTMLWLKSHCSSINSDDFVVNDNPKKCVPVVSQPEIIEVGTVEQPSESDKDKTTYAVVDEQENVTVTPMPEFEFTTRTHRTNRLEVLEEYYSNVTTNFTNGDQLEETSTMEIKEIVVLSANVSASEESDRANVTIVEQIKPVTNETMDEEVPMFVLHKAVINGTVDGETPLFELHKEVINETVDEQVPLLVLNKAVTNETVDEEVPLFVLHKAVVNETVTEVLPENPVTTESVSNPLSESNESTEANINMTTPVNSSTTSITPTTGRPLLQDSTEASINMTVSVNSSTTSVTSTTEKQLLSESTTFLNVETSTVSATTEYETSTTMIETTMELTTTEATTSTSAIPADCPALKDCPFDYCAFTRKFDNRGCPTCNCVQSNKSNITCPPLTCQACLYGHHTDPNGCPVCQCQSRPYPPLGERCPHLNCEPCYFGTVKDEYNCDTCVCIRPNNQECPVLNCAFGPCKYGSIKDEDDCPTCDCLLPTINTTEVNCSTPISCPSCHLGYVIDADGCQTCQCKLRGSVACTSISSQCQCDYGSYLNSDGCETCSCLPDPKNASRQACWELSNQANFHNLSGPTCSLDGSFYARQCDKSQSKCWCVTPTGIHISGFESRPEENVNCACAVELYQVSSLRMIGHHLLCLLNGNYAPIQCDGRYCSCVDENGKPIGPSVSIQNRDQLRCVGVYQQLHPERFLLHRANIEQSDHSRLSYGMSSSLCLKHLEQVRNANVTDDHFLIPVCDVNGLYASVQCDQSERYCWCVDKKTGVEMDGTRRLNARPNCNIV